MKKSIRRCLLSELRLHPELERLGSQIERHCIELKVSFNSLCPLVHRVISITPDSEIIGNLPAYRKAVARGTKSVRVYNMYLLALEDPAVITLRAITSVARRGYTDPLLLGLIYRTWAAYEESYVPLRPALEIKQAQRDLYGMTLRDHLHEDLSRRLGRSQRDLQRLASVLSPHLDRWSLRDNVCFTFGGIAMYSVVLMVAMTTSVDAPACGRAYSCHGCYGGCYGCYGGCWGGAV